jgi:polyadenylate-binding protein
VRGRRSFPQKSKPKKTTKQTKQKQSKNQNQKTNPTQPNPNPIQPTTCSSLFINDIIMAAPLAPAPAAGSFQSTSLYVGDLGLDITEGNLFELFNTVGPVASIRVCRDAVTRRSLGYAYVNFHSPNDAERALDTLNNNNLRGRPIRVMWSQRDPSVRKSGVGNIFIKNLDKSIDHKALYDTFSDFGNILSCKVALDEKGVSKGYGFVHYETQKNADDAIAKVNGCVIGSSPVPVYVGKFISKKERQLQNAQNFTNVFVKNLSLNATYEDVETLFSQYGKITSGVIMKTEEGKPKGFGFFNFESHEAAKAAVDNLNNSEFQGKVIYVARAQKKSERKHELQQTYRSYLMDSVRKGTNLYVKNLDDDVTDAMLQEEFKKFGNITSAVVMKDERDNSRGFGFVCFSTPDEANRAVTEMNNKQIWSKPLYVSFAQRKEERRAQLEAQYRMTTQRPPRAQQIMPMYPFAQPNLPLMYPQMMPRQRWNATAQGIPFQQGVPFVNQLPPGQQIRPGQQPGIRGQPFTPAAAAAAAAGRPQMFRRPEKPGEEPLTVEYLSQFSPEHQFLMVSQRLYPVIMKAQPELAPKITGMLRSWYLEHHQGPEELLRLLEDPVALNTKIAEAMEIWEEHVRNTEAVNAGQDAPVAAQ